ncbi:MAG TPA: pitrilysin family protein [Terriglobales bacterium]|nr:pitrilysin family protein [Terriglobales bacterium]
MSRCLRFGALLLALFLLASSLPAQTKPAPAKKPAPASFFPYKIYSHKLPNGLTVLIIPTPEFKDMVTYATPVFAGSRNETEKGKSGLAHLFEHIMFRHEYGGKPGGYAAMMDAMGADNNAWTNYDLTFYHPFTFAQNLVGPVETPQGPVPGIIALEADRFQHLTMQRKVFEVEAGAVLGEYRRIFSFPQEKMVEVMSPEAFPAHPYGHTVIGYREDVENMPKAWDSAWEFFHNYYTPNDVAVIVVGDVDPDKLFPVIEKAYAGWKPVHVDWEAEVAPHLMVGYHTPAMKIGSSEGAIALVLGELLTSRSSPLFQKLRYEKQSVTDFSMFATPDSTDPQWMMLDCELSLERFQKEGNGYVQDVQGDVITGVEALQHFSRQKDAAKTLEVIKSKVKNDFLAQLNTTENIATTVAWYYRFNRDPDSIDELMRSMMALKPADIDAYAQKYFNAQGRIVGTLWQNPKAEMKPAEVR